MEQCDIFVLFAINIAALIAFGVVGFDLFPKQLWNGYSTRTKSIGIGVLLTVVFVTVISNIAILVFS